MSIRAMRRPMPNALTILDHGLAFADRAKSARRNARRSTPNIGIYQS